MTNPAAALLDSPAFPAIVARLDAALADERERRRLFREDLAPDVKAEVINGEIIMHSPARARHVQATLRLAKLLDTYVTLHGLGFVGAEKAMVGLTRNDYEPDVCFFGAEKAAQIEPETVEFPAPDLVAEVLSPKTEHRDRGVKFEDYAAHDVAEYWIVDPAAEVVEQYVLGASGDEPSGDEPSGDEPSGDEPSGDGARGPAYALRMKSATGTLASHAAEGSAVPVRALFDDAANLDALRTVLA